MRSRVKLACILNFSPEEPYAFKPFLPKNVRQFRVYGKNATKNLIRIHADLAFNMNIPKRLRDKPLTILKIVCKYSAFLTGMEYGLRGL